MNRMTPGRALMTLGVVFTDFGDLV